MEDRFESAKDETDTMITNPKKAERPAITHYLIRAIDEPCYTMNWLRISQCGRRLPVFVIRVPLQIFSTLHTNINVFALE